MAQSLASGERRTLIRNGSDARYLPTRHIVYAVAGTVYGVTFDLATLTVKGEAVPVVTGIRRAFPTGVNAATQFSVSSNGSLLCIPGPLISQGQGTMRVPTLVDRAGTRVPLALPPKVYTRPRVSPDGSRLDFHPAWGPSGRDIFYVPSANEDALVAVGVQIAESPTFGTPTPLKGVQEPDFISTGHRGYDVLPDGRFITLLPVESGPAGVRPELRVVLNWFDELKRLVPTQ